MPAERLPDPFLRADERLRPLLLARGFRLAGIEYPDRARGSAFAEYARRGQRVRLVWEGEARALWLESARQEGAEVVSRWTDVEWSLAGERLPLDQELGEARIERLAQAVERYLGAPE
ncbi:MAG TPA: hypothetical protein VFS07_10020 [Gemmatimonadales bacterium]|nr:hypothetical protein [Gemmatimonadales bacterium]